MEITVDIINEASAIQAQPYARFQTYFQAWEPYSSADIVNGKVDNNGAHEIWSTVRTVLAKLDYPQHRAAAMFELAEIVAFLNNVFKKAFDEADLRELLIFLTVYSALISRLNSRSNSDVSIDYFVDFNHIQAEQIEKLVGIVLTLVKTFRAEISLSPDTPYHERELFDNYVTGVSEGQLGKAYRLIQAMENGRGIMTGNLIEQMYRLVFTLKPEQFADLLSLKSKPVEFISAIQWMSKKELVGLSAFTFPNQWLIFEALRQLGNAQQKEEVDGEIKAGAVFLAQIYSLSRPFYFQVLDYFKSDPLRNASIGLQLSELSTTGLSEVVDTCFSFQSSNTNATAKKQLLYQFAKQATTDQFDGFIKLVFDKWLSFIKALEHDPDYYANGLVLTDYADYIVEFQVSHARLQPLDAQLKSTIQAIATINETWFRSKSTRNNHFFIKLSELFLLSYAVNEMSRQGIKTESGDWGTLYNDQLIRSVYLKRDHTQIMEVINQNLS